MPVWLIILSRSILEANYPPNSNIILTEARHAKTSGLSSFRALVSINRDTENECVMKGKAIVRCIGDGFLQLFAVVLLLDLVEVTSE